MKIFIAGCLLIACFFISCETGITYRFENPQNAFTWIVENFEYKSTGYKSAAETIESRTGDCYTLSILLCELMQDSYEPEIVVGVFLGSWHAIAKIGNTYFDPAMKKQSLKNPFTGYSLSMPWRLAKGYKFYARFVENRLKE